MADDRLIPAYLRELRLSVGRLRAGDDIVAEAEDHLRESAERLMAQGRTTHEAEAEALARFGSAALVAKVCITESTKGAAVPTTTTRLAGFALLLAPILLIVGEWGNENTDNTGGMHGTAVFVLCLAFPALIFGLWGLRTRHGGLGRLGRAAFGLALLSPILAHAALYAAGYGLAVLLALALVVFGAEMLRASVLPVPPLTLVIAGPVLVIVELLVATAVTIAGRDAGHPPTIVLAMPIMITAVGLAWLGWHLSQETAVDRAGSRPLATT
jgi:hypothetical protein